MDEWRHVEIVTAGAALLCAASVLSRLLAMARTPGGDASASILGGLLAGILLGATVFGGLAPEFSERIFFGAVHERQALNDMRFEHASEIAALRRLDVSPVAVAEQMETQEYEIAAVYADFERVRAAHQATWRTMFVTLVVLWLLIGSFGGARVPKRISTARTALSAGVGLAFFAGAPTFLLTRWLLELDVFSAAALACAVGAGGAIADVRTRSIGLAGRRRTVDFTGFVALTLVALILGMIDQRPATIAFVSSILAAAFTHLHLGLNRPLRRVCRATATGVLLPAVAAVAVARLDLRPSLSDLSFWLMAAIAFILGSDGRLLGVWMGLRATAPRDELRGRWRQSAATLTTGVGGAQVALIGLAGLIDMAPPPVVWAGAIGALTVELFAPIRRRIAAPLDAMFGSGEGSA